MSVKDVGFIETIKSFRCIWDLEHPDHKNKVIVENAWKAIATIFKIPVDECQQLWKNLRARYSLMKKSISGSINLFDAMAFLEPPNQLHMTKENVLGKRMSLATDTNAGGSSTEDSDTDIPSTKQNEQCRNKKRKLELNVNQLVKACTNIAENCTALIETKKLVPKPNVEDEDYYFSLCILHYLSKIGSHKKKLLLKSKIFGMLAEEMDD